MTVKTNNGKGPETGSGHDQNSKPAGMTKGMTPLEGSDSSLMGQPAQKTIPELAADLKEGNEKSVRQAAAEAIYEIARKTPQDPVLQQFVPQLIELVRDGDLYVAVGAASALGHIGDERAIPVLDEAMRRAGIAPYAIMSLNRLGAISKFSEALKDDNWLVRYGGVMGLGESGHPEAIVPLAEALNDKHTHVQWAAVTAFGVLAQSTTISTPLLVEALSKMDPSMKEMGKDILKGIGYSIE
jgi:HEAT repeat protein